jgi:hypothetical protein
VAATQQSTTNYYQRLVSESVAERWGVDISVVQCVMWASGPDHFLSVDILTGQITDPLYLDRARYFGSPDSVRILSLGPYYSYQHAAEAALQHVRSAK